MRLTDRINAQHPKLDLPSRIFEKINSQSPKTFNHSQDSNPHRLLKTVPIALDNESILTNTPRAAAAALGWGGAKFLQPYHEVE